MTYPGINTGIGFSRVFTRTIPGSVLTIGLAVSSGYTEPDIISNVEIEILLFLLLSVIFGEVIELIRKKFFFVPPEFRRYVYSYRGEQTDLTTLQTLGETNRSGVLGGLARFLFEENQRDFTKTSTHDKVYYKISNMGHSGPADTSVTHLYIHLLSDLESDLSSSTLDSKLLMEFSQNIKIPLWVLIAIGLSTIFSGDINTVQLVYLLLVTIALLLYPYIVIFKQSSSDKYFNHLMIDAVNKYTLTEE
jgi:hypothetical protein